MIVDLNTGAIANWVRFEGKITELYDVQIIPNVKRPMALGFQTNEIAQLITLEELENDFVTTQPQKRALTISPQRQQEQPKKSIISKEAQNIWLASYPRSGNTLLRTILWRCFGLRSGSIYPKDLGNNQELAQEVGHIEHSTDGQINFPQDSLRLIKTHEHPPNDEPAIYIVRDGRAAAVSLSRFYQQAISVEDVIRGKHHFGNWAEHLQAWQPWQRPNTLLLRYEEITNNLGQVLEKISQFLQRDIIAKELPDRDRLAQIDGQWVSPKTDWRDYISEPELALFEQVNGKMMLKLDYPRQIPSKTSSQRQLKISQRQNQESNTKLAKTFFERSRVLKKSGNIAEAELCLREAIRVKSDYWGAYNNLGTLLQNQGNIEEAKFCYQKAIAFKPDFAQAISNLASIEQLEENWDKAKNGYYQALQLKPDYVPAHFNLANIFKEQKRLGAAIEHFEKVIALQPDYTEAYISLGNIFEYQDKLEKALDCYQKALEINPSFTYLNFNIAMVKLRFCDWHNYEQNLEQLLQLLDGYQQQGSFPGVNTFALSALPVSLPMHQAAAQSQAQTISNQVTTHQPFKHDDHQPQKLRIGFISPDFREHAVGRLIHKIFPYFDLDRFDIYAYSTVDVNDQITKAVRSGCDVFVDLSPLSTEAAARRIYDDGIHIMIDLAGYTIGNGAKILALQPATIQAQWLGYPDTMGAEFMQYYLGDRTLIADEIAEHYTEEIIYLPHTFVASPLKISEKVMTREEFGLPDNAFVFCCFNSHYKITPELFDLWLRILEQVPKSVLWLASGGGKENLRLAAQKRGLAENRLIFAEKIPHDEYLARYALADLYLDTFIYNAGSTAAAVLWTGLPMLTCPGKTNASRMGASICLAGGLESAICDSPEEYEQRAVHLATHPGELAQIREELRSQLQSEATYPPLFQVTNFVRSLEAAFEQMWNQKSPDVEVKSQESKVTAR